MKVWAKTEEFSEGKFLVVRRDGTIPDWPHFVMGARDPAVPAALIAYSEDARAEGMDPAFSLSVYELAHDFRAYRAAHGDGDPDAPPHRTDLPLAIAMMRHVFDVADIASALERIEVACAEGRPEAAQAIARILLDGHRPPRLR
jgi:hypothetical protein